MKHILKAAFIFCFFTTALFAADQSLYSFSKQEDEARFHSITQEVRCVVCQNQSIADSSAPLADDLRHKIYNLILSHHSDAEIKTYLIKRYGNFILLKPPFMYSTLALWLFPLFALTIALAMLYRFLLTKRDGVS